MCGIAGIYSAEVQERDIDVMVAAMCHRGPDELGTYVDDRIGVGAARLAIIDIERGQQPFFDSGAGVVVVFNGEIYNHPELRRQLESKGHEFRSDCDTEVILRLYLEYGVAFPTHMNGQFAVAIWDRPRQRLLLARDRIGKRPLFYYHSDSMLVFASEIKSILATGRVPRRFNERALDQVFTFWVPIGQHSAVAGVLELPPGCLMVFEGGSSRISRYWTWPFPKQDLMRRATMDDLREEFLGELRKAIALRLRADVEVGAYLSGGIDSSSIVNLVSECRPSGLKTFSIGFEEEGYDESPYQELVAAHHRTQHCYHRCSYDDIERVFEPVVWHAEAPLFRTAPAPLFMLSRAVRDNGLKVVLTGEGSDEVLLGYDIFREVKVRRSWARNPESSARPQVFKRLYAYLPQFSNPRYAALAIQSFKPSLHSNSPFYSHVIRWMNSVTNKVYYSDELKAQLKGYVAEDELASSLPEDYSTANDVDKAQYLEVSTLLRGYLLSSQGDRMSMAHSVEGRYPFLDHEFVEYASRLPRRAKLAGMKDKFILRNSMRGRLPDGICQRPKIAYQAPEIRPFIRSDGSRSRLVDQYLSRPALERVALFAPAMVEQLVKKAVASSLTRMGTRDNMAFVQILSTQILFHRFILEDPKSEALARLKHLQFGTRIHNFQPSPS
jgi:asparagine synthase (glutamine-hydrolysing)